MRAPEPFFVVEEACPIDEGLVEVVMPIRSGRG